MQRWSEDHGGQTGRHALLGASDVYRSGEKGGLLGFVGGRFCVTLMGKISRFRQVTTISIRSKVVKSDLFGFVSGWHAMSHAGFWGLSTVM